MGTPMRSALASSSKPGVVAAVAQDQRQPDVQTVVHVEGWRSQRGVGKPLQDAAVAL
jgi:hypothetical protein